VLLRIQFGGSRGGAVGGGLQNVVAARPQCRFYLARPPAVLGVRPVPRYEFTVRLASIDSRTRR
jgi:hypothetical protein